MQPRDGATGTVGVGGSINIDPVCGIFSFSVFLESDKPEDVYTVSTQFFPAQLLAKEPEK